MAYVVAQYNHPKNTPIRMINNESKNNWVAGRTDIDANNEVEDLKLDIDFQDESLYSTTKKFDTSKNYYFKCQIKKIDTVQNISIKLCNVDKNGKIKTDDDSQQFIKRISVPMRNPNISSAGWMDVEFIFNPILDFNCIIFQLKRIEEDFSKDTKRYPKIVYEQLGEINNFIENKKMLQQNDNKNLYKLGVQSNPGFMMCINGEEIHTPYNGIYEVRSSDVLVNFFTPIVPDVQSEDTISAKQKIDNDYEAEIPSVNIPSVCCFGDGGNQIPNNFIIDYMYEA